MSTTTTTADAAMETPNHPWWLTLIQGILTFIVGGILLWAPAKDKVDTWQLLIAILGFYWLVLGIMDIVRIFTDSTGWGWKQVRLNDGFPFIRIGERNVRFSKTDIDAWVSQRAVNGSAVQG